MNTSHPSGISRRSMLKTVAVAGLGATLPRTAFGQAAASIDRRAQLMAYLESLRRPDGGYSYDDLAESHLTPTFAVIGCYQVLGQEPPDKRKLVEFVRTHHPAQLRKQEQEHHDFEVQQIQSLLWLGEDVSGFKAQVQGWKVPYQYLPQYEKNRCPIFRSEMASFTCRKMLGLPLSDLSPAYLDYFNVRRRANGSFNNTPADDGSDGNILNTLWGLQALAVLGRLEEKKKETIAWLQACQLPNGGFTHQPKAEFAGVDDVAYTWAALKALKMLEAAPLNTEASIQYLFSLANEDGGFGDRHNWRSNPVATFYALQALETLGALNRAPESPSKSKPMERGAPPKPWNWRVR
jgi:prenyltransferase beta subunit